MQERSRRRRGRRATPIAGIEPIGCDEVEPARTQTGQGVAEGVRAADTPAVDTEPAPAPPEEHATSEEPQLNQGTAAPSPALEPPELPRTAGSFCAASSSAEPSDDRLTISSVRFRRSFSFPAPLVADRSSTGMEHLEAVAHQAFETLMKPSMRITAAGILCLVGPPALLLSVPVVLLLLPLLFPLGLVLTVVGLVRAGIVASFDGSRFWHSSTNRRNSSPTSASSPATPTGAHVRSHRARDAMFVSSCEPKGRETFLGVSTMTSTDRNERGLVHPRRMGGREETLSPCSSFEQQIAKIDGSLSTLNSLTTQRGERLVRQVGTLVRDNVARATNDIRAEVEAQLQALQRELQSWVGANPNLKPYCHGRIGWLLRGESPSAPDVTTTFLKRYLAGRPDGQPAPPLSTADVAAMPMPEGMQMGDLEFLLVPGLLTKWYPLYMAQLRADFKRLGLKATFSRIDTDQPVRLNAARVRHEVLELAQGRSARVVILGHSKGAVDAAAAISLFPELIDPVAALVSIQGPHGGSALAHDLANTTVQRSVALNMLLERLLRGCRHAVLDLSFSARQEFIKAHPYPIDRVPALCLSSCDRGASSLLKPVIDFFALRYGEWSDGCVCQADAILPGCPRILLNDMDHFGPGWPSFPATDRYDPARLWLLATSLALTTPSSSADAGASLGGTTAKASPQPDSTTSHQRTGRSMDRGTLREGNARGRSITSKRRR